MLFPKLNQLQEAGYKALENRQFERALRIARRIHKKRNTSAFEIEGRAFWALGRTEEAIAALEAGAAVAPSVYLFWSYLGHYYSDLGNYEKAIECLNRGMFLDAPEGEFEYNLAVVHGRNGDPEMALLYLERFNWQDSVFNQALLRASRAYWLARVDRAEEALQECDQASLHINEETDADSRSRIVSTRAYAYHLLGRPSESVRRLAHEALQILKTDEAARWLLREVDGKPSASARKGVLTIEGRRSHPTTGKIEAYTTVFAVLAETEEQALEMVRPFEPLESQSTLRVVKIDWLDPYPDVPMGVYDVELEKQ